MEHHLQPLKDPLNWFAGAMLLIIIALIAFLACCGCSSTNKTVTSPISPALMATRSAAMASGNGLPKLPVIPPSRLTNGPATPAPVTAFTISSDAPCTLQGSYDLKNWQDLGSLSNSVIYSNVFEVVRAFRGRQDIQISWVNDTIFPVLISQWTTNASVGYRHYAVPVGTNSVTVLAMEGTNHFSFQTFSGDLGPGTSYSGAVNLDFLPHSPSLMITKNNRP